jgi:hypothetical protein
MKDTKDTKTMAGIPTITVQIELKASDRELLKAFKRSAKAIKRFERQMRKARRRQ